MSEYKKAHAILLGIHFRANWQDPAGIEAKSMRISNGFKQSQKHCDRLLLEFALLAKTLGNYFPFDSILLFWNDYSSRFFIQANPITAIIKTGIKISHQLTIQ